MIAVLLSINGDPSELLHHLEKKSSILSQVKPYLVLVRNNIVNKYEKSRNEDTIIQNKEEYQTALKLLAEVRNSIDDKICQLLNEQVKHKLEQKALVNHELEKIEFFSNQEEGNLMDLDEAKAKGALLKKKRGR